MSITNESVVVWGDLHGNLNKAEAVLDWYGSDVKHIAVGDVLGKVCGTQETLDLMIDAGVQTVKGNHEWVAMAAMLSINRESRHIWQERVWPRYGSELLLRSYGVEAPDRASAAKALKASMAEADHLKFLREAPLYLEGARFIIVHAGLTDKPWEAQRQFLDEAHERTLKGDYDDEPQQVFDDSHALANDPAKSAATDKVVVTGHSHLDLRSHERVTASGKRVRLASNTHQGQPFYVWESWTGKVVSF